MRHSVADRRGGILGYEAVLFHGRNRKLLGTRGNGGIVAGTNRNHERPYLAVRAAFGRQWSSEYLLAADTVKGFTHRAEQSLEVRASLTRLTNRSFLSECRPEKQPPNEKGDDTD